MMVGGDAEVVKRLAPIFQTLAPGPDKGWGQGGPGRRGTLREDGPQRNRVRNHAGVRGGARPFPPQEGVRLDLLQISKIWQFGSVVRSWLLDLTVDALSKNPTLDGIGAYVTDSGEGRWTAIEGIELGRSAADADRGARCAIPLAGSGTFCQQAAVR